MDEEKERIYRRDWFAISIGILIAIIITFVVIGLAFLGNKKYEKFEEHKRLYFSSTSEIERFNSSFNSYEGMQKGSHVKELMVKLIENTNTYSNVPSYNPVVSYNTNEKLEDDNKVLSNQAYGVMEENEIDGYVSYIEALSKGIRINEDYYVLYTMGIDGLVKGITINYIGTERDREGVRENFQYAKANEESFDGIRAIDGISLDAKEGEKIKAGIKYSVKK